MENKIRIVEIFSEIPGGRYKKDGPGSGEEFREKYLKPKYESLRKDQKLLIDFDGAYGYPPSFLDEAFGGIARIFGSKEVLDKLEFKSDEEPSLIDEVIGYIKNEKPSR